MFLSAAALVNLSELISGRSGVGRMAAQMAAGGMLPLLFPGILFVFGMMGAGDVKLLSVIGFWLGGGAVMRIIPVSFGIAAAVSLCLMLARGNVRQRMHVFLQYAADCVRSRAFLPYPACGAGGSLHFSPCILLAVLIWGVSEGGL